MKIDQCVSQKCIHYFILQYITDNSVKRCKKTQANIHLSIYLCLSFYLCISSGPAEVSWTLRRASNELQDALCRTRDTSAGPDEIHYQLLKHLPDASLLLLLDIFNKIWISGDFPPDWRKAIIIPIPNPGKDPTNPTNYRRIALTRCTC